MNNIVLTGSIDPDTIILIFAAFVILATCVVLNIVFSKKKKVKPYKEEGQEQIAVDNPEIKEEKKSFSLNEEVVENNDKAIESESQDNLVIEEEKPENVSKSRKGKYEVFKDGEFYRYLLKASNGEILFESDFCFSEQACLDAIDIIKKNIELGIYQIVQDKNQMYQFKLSARNHRTLVISGYYTTKKGADEASISFKKNALTDTIVFLGEDLKDSNIGMEVYEDNIVGNDNTGQYRVLPNGKKFYFVLKASNGMVLCHSQDYVSKTSCITGLEAFRSVVYDGTFYIAQDKNDKYQFKLYNQQNKLIMVSDLYDTKNKVISYIKLIKRYARLGQI